MDTESVAPSEVAPSKADTDEPSNVSMTNSAAPLDTADQSQVNYISVILFLEKLQVYSDLNNRCFTLMILFTVVSLCLF